MNATATRTTVHHLTNGQFNYSFRITGEQATLTIFGGKDCNPEVRTMTTEEARKAYKTLLELMPNIRKGFTSLPRYRRITTEAQLAEYIGQETDGNWAEWALGIQEEFEGMGYIEIAC